MHSLSSFDMLISTPRSIRACYDTAWLQCTRYTSIEHDITTGHAVQLLHSAAYGTAQKSI